ncbi:hypothetical protein FA13DRAFT_1802189 [Coprinellus micaceus]|uniref:Uncharacterized protein n=1 Tax=Coprinellus micaceus TaxID=71717 RepID=A0A4Y7SCM5_COPMI|nr:hypothetical protein FA13DRAFT_1802189 [Coprinellus micaceus]
MSEERPIQAYYDSYAYDDSRSSTRSSSVSHDYQANDMVYDRGVSTRVGHSDRQFFSSHGRSSQTAGYGYQSGSSTPFTSQNTPMRGRLQGHPNLSQVLLQNEAYLQAILSADHRTLLFVENQAYMCLVDENRQLREEAIELRRQRESDREMIVTLREMKVDMPLSGSASHSALPPLYKGLGETPALKIPKRPSTITFWYEKEWNAVRETFTPPPGALKTLGFLQLENGVHCSKTEVEVYRKYADGLFSQLVFACLDPESFEKRASGVGEYCVGHLAVAFPSPFALGERGWKGIAFCINKYPSWKRDRRPGVREALYQHMKLLPDPTPVAAGSKRPSEERSGPDTVDLRDDGDAPPSKRVKTGNSDGAKKRRSRKNKKEVDLHSGTRRPSEAPQGNIVMDLSGPSATTSTSPATTPPATLATVPLATIPATADETSKQSDPGQAILGPESTNLINSSSTSSLHVLPTDTAIPSGSAQLNGTTPLVLATQDGDKTSDETNALTSTTTSSTGSQNDDLGARQDSRDPEDAEPTLRNCTNNLYTQATSQAAEPQDTSKEQTETAISGNSSLIVQLPDSQATEAGNSPGASQPIPAPPKNAGAVGGGGSLFGVSAMNTLAVPKSTAAPPPDLSPSAPTVQKKAAKAYTEPWDSDPTKGGAKNLFGCDYAAKSTNAFVSKGEVSDAWSDLGKEGQKPWRSKNSKANAEKKKALATIASQQQDDSGTSGGTPA